MSDDAMWSPSLVHTGEGRVLIALTADETETLAYASPDVTLRDRLLTALALLDSARAENVRVELAPCGARQ